MADLDVRTRPGHRGGTAILAMAGAAALVGTATYVLLTEGGRWPGVLAGGAGALLLWSTLSVRRQGDPLTTFMDSLVDRAYDGCLLSATVLVAREADPVAAAAATAALVAGFLAAYERSRGRALGYPMDDGLAPRGTRYALISAGLGVPGLLRGAMIALLVLTALTAMVRASQVAKKERE
jgi:hypothetical protein